MTSKDMQKCSFTLNFLNGFSWFLLSLLPSPVPSSSLFHVLCSHKHKFCTQQTPSVEQRQSLLNEFLNNLSSASLYSAVSLKNLLKRPEINIEDLLKYMNKTYNEKPILKDHLYICA